MGGVAMLVISVPALGSPTSTRVWSSSIAAELAAGGLQ